MTLRPIRAVIFDLDGTLADTFSLIVAAWNAAVSPHTGKTYSDADVISRFGPPDPAMIRKELSGEAGELAIETYHDYLRREHSNRVKPFAGIPELLAALTERRMPMAICTGKGRRSARITLDALGWSDLFPAVVTGEDVERRKPSPEPLLKAAGFLDLSPQDCAFVGDSPVDIGAGQAAGALTIAAAWHPVYLERIRAMKPDVWAESPNDVALLLSRSS